IYSPPIIFYILIWVGKQHLFLFLRKVPTPKVHQTKEQRHESSSLRTPRRRVVLQPASQRLRHQSTGNCVLHGSPTGAHVLLRAAPASLRGGTAVCEVAWLSVLEL